MTPRHPHRWNVTPKEGVATQREVRERLVLRDGVKPVYVSAGHRVLLATAIEPMSAARRIEWLPALPQD